MSELQRHLEAQLLNRTVEKVEVDERFTADGNKKITLKITFDNGHTLEFGMGGDDGIRPLMPAM